MAVFRSGEDHAGNRGHRRGLRGTALRSASTAGRGSLPDPLAVIDAKGEHPAALGRIERVRPVVAPGQQRDLKVDVGKRDVHIAAIGGRSPLNASDRAALAHPRLPEDLAAAIRIDRISHAGLLAHEERARLAPQLAQFEPAVHGAPAGHGWVISSRRRSTVTAVPRRFATAMRSLVERGAPCCFITPLSSALRMAPGVMAWSADLCGMRGPAWTAAS